jgi:hypothetical protein
MDCHEDSLCHRFPVLSGLFEHDRVGHTAFNALLRGVTPLHGMRSEKEYIEILAVMEEKGMRSLPHVGEVRIQRLAEAKAEARKWIEFNRTPSYCRGCAGTCCTGVGSDPCTCEGTEEE